VQSTDHNRFKEVVQLESLGYIWLMSKIEVNVRDDFGAQENPLLDASVAISRSNSPLNEMEQLVTARRLLEILWADESRPSLKWLRRQVKCRMIPYIKRGRLYFFRPSSVMEWFRQKECFPVSMHLRDKEP
jgi:hypothetical protein